MAADGSLNVLIPPSILLVAMRYIVGLELIIDDMIGRLLTK